MIIKIWPIEAKNGSIERNLKNSIDYIQDTEKTTKKTKEQIETEDFDKDILTQEIFEINTSDNFNRVFAYTYNQEKTEGYVSGYLCDPKTAVEDFIKTKIINLARIGEELGDDTGHQAYHIVQSFPEELDISDEEVHRCGQELVERIGVHQAVICSHIHPVVDEENEVHGRCKHNHIIINSHIHHDLVDKDNPRRMKYHDCNDTYALLQLYNDEIALEHGLPIIASPNRDKMYSWYETAERNQGKSWKARVRSDIEKSARVSHNFEEFRREMANEGYSIYEGTSAKYGKYLTFTTPNGKKVRDYVLGGDSTYEYLTTFWNVKEKMAEEIKKNAELANANPMTTLVQQTEGKLFINITRTISESRRKRLKSMGKTIAPSYTYLFPVPEQYNEDFSSEKTYYDPKETYDITNDKNQVVATLTGAEILGYYKTLEDKANIRETKETKKDAFYSNPVYINSRTQKPYQVSRYDEYGHKRSLLELIILMAIIILNKERRYSRYEDEDQVVVLDKSPLVATRAWKIENMVDTLRITREENIKTPAELQDRLTQTGKNLSKARAEIRRISQALQNMDEIHESIVEFQSVRELCESIWNMPPGNKKESMKKRHEEQLEVYNKAKAVLYHHKIANDQDIEDFAKRYEHLSERLEKAEENQDMYKEEYRRLSKLRYNVQLAQQKAFLYGPEVDKNEGKDQPGNEPQNEKQER